MLSTDTLESVESAVKCAVRLYNKYRSPEATVEIVEFEGETLKARFSGSYCLSCGVYDWIEDFKYVLEDCGLKSELLGVVEPEDPSLNYRIGVFKILHVKSGNLQ